MQFYIDGAWVDPPSRSPRRRHPATEEAMYEVALGSKADVDKAVLPPSARSRLFADQPRGARRALVRIIEVYKTRMKDIAPPCPTRWRAVADGREAAGRRRPRPSRLHPEVLKKLPFRGAAGSAMVVRDLSASSHDHAVELAAEPDRLQVAPALAAGCTIS